MQIFFFLSCVSYSIMNPLHFILSKSSAVIGDFVACHSSSLMENDGLETPSSPPVLPPTLCVWDSQNRWRYSVGCYTDRLTFNCSLNLWGGFPLRAPPLPHKNWIPQYPDSLCLCGRTSCTLTDRHTHTHRAYRLWHTVAFIFRGPHVFIYWCWGLLILIAADKPGCSDLIAHFYP